MSAPETGGPGLLYVVPTFLGRSAAIEAPWIAAAQFASAIGDRMGGSQLLTQRGLLSPSEAEELSVLRTTQPSAARATVRALPPGVRASITEVRRWYRARVMRGLANRLTQAPYRMVMQLHSRHQDAGLLLARRLRVPFVLRLESLELREEVAWGMQRPRWAGAAERWGERRVILRSDLVAAVSEVLDAQLAALGVEEGRRVVVPNGVDLDLFSPGERDDDLIRANGLEGRFVVGWVGGFRPFHGLDAIPSIADRLRTEAPGAALCLVGAGQERDRIAGLSKGMEDVVRLVGPAAHSDVPRWIRSFDACLLLGRSDDFHYSPMKLYEYLGCGRPVVAAGVGQVASVLTDGRDGLLVPPEDPAAVAGAVARLTRDRSLAERLGAEGRRTAERSASWGARADALLAAMESRGLFVAPAARRGAST